MQPDPRAEAERWLEQARQDVSDAEFNRQGGRHNVCCFLCQQAAEKALKAFLILRTGVQPRGHSVASLTEAAAKLDEGFNRLPNGGGLDLYYIPTRYPNGLPGGLPSNAFDDAHSTRALEHSRGFIDHVAQVFAAPEPEDEQGS